MKNLILILSLSLPLELWAQVHIESTAITIQQYSVFTVDSLILLPGVDLTLQNTELTHTNTNVSLASGNTINAIYKFSIPVTFTGFVQMRYNPLELAGNSESGLQMITAPSNSPVTWVTTTGTIVDLTNKIISQNYYNTSLALISATSPSVSLPIELTSFDVQKSTDNLSSLIIWKVAKELNIKEYEVERSLDGNRFEYLGSSLAKGVREYTFEDIHPAKGWNYYRLRIVEHDGKFSYSVVRKLLFELEKSEISVFPNPVNSLVTLHSTDEKLLGTTASVVDAGGKIVATFKIQPNSTDVNAGAWATGIYFIRLANGMSFKLEKR